MIPRQEQHGGWQTQRERGVDGKKESRERAGVVEAVWRTALDASVGPPRDLLVVVSGVRGVRIVPPPLLAEEIVVEAGKR